MERVQEIVQQRLHDDAKLQYMPAEAVHTELMQEMDRCILLSAIFFQITLLTRRNVRYRYPLVERAIADLPMLSDPSFNAGIRKRLDDLVKAKPQNGTQTTLDDALLTHLAMLVPQVRRRREGDRMLPKRGLIVASPLHRTKRGGTNMPRTKSRDVYQMLKIENWRSATDGGSEVVIRTKM